MCFCAQKIFLHLLHFPTAVFHRAFRTTFEQFKTAKLQQRQRTFVYYLFSLDTFVVLSICHQDSVRKTSIKIIAANRPSLPLSQRARLGDHRCPCMRPDGGGNITRLIKKVLKKMRVIVVKYRCFSWTEQIANVVSDKIKSLC